MTPDQLRQALGICEKAAAPEGVYRREYDQILDAARRWLRLQEADEQMVRIITLAIVGWLGVPIAERDLEMGRAVLAAITEEDQK